MDDVGKRILYNDARNKYIKIGAVAAAVLVVLIFILTRGGVGSFYDKYSGYDLTEPPSGRMNIYARYMEKHANAATPQVTVDVDIFAFNEETAEGVEIKNNYHGNGDALLTTDVSTVEFSVDVPEAGLYNLMIDYYPVESRGVDIERAVLINGELPFMGADIVTFYRLWGDMPGGNKYDNQGNQIRPSQVEFPRWKTVRFTDSQGYVIEPYRFYFNAGENTITLVAVNEPLAIRSLKLVPVRVLPTYEEYLKGYDLSQFKGSIGNEPLRIQGEDSSVRSSPSLYAFFDTSSGTTEPYSVTTITLNAIGGDRWRVPGQWIEWEVNVPESGMYRLSIRARQNFNRSMVSNRTLYINGEVPFKEALAMPFVYENSWQLVTPQDDDGNELLFPLEKGINTIRLEVTLGDLSEILARMEESIYRLNQIYLRILVLTGASPDPYRDYDIDKNYPEIMDLIDFEYRYVYKLVDDLVAFSGEMGPEAASLQAIARQLEIFSRSPQEIPKLMVNFKENIAGMGNSLIGLNMSSLSIDWLAVSDVDNPATHARDTFLSSAVHEVKSFFATFFIDYNNLGDVHTGRDVTEVWIFSGRDQSLVLKSMIDDTYTPMSGNPVNLKLVQLDALMPAVVAGTGPDVALTVNNGDPINYAFRRASKDLSGFDGFRQVAGEFHESALVPYRYRDSDGNDGVFGLPETQIFGVMFYRTDILENLGVEPPQTWDDVISLFSVLKSQNMSIGIPSVERKINNMIVPDLSNFFSQLYQRNGTLYNEDGSRCLLDGEQAVKAFEFYTRFFTHYKAPLHYDFVNRFRSGEMPIGFADYNNFNTLAVFAPEIRGLWEFDILPGTRMPDGSINRSTASWGQACMMLSNAKDENKAWDFMKWWVSADTQVRFGREMESIMGSSARHPTANRDAFEQLAWNARDTATIRAQWEWVVGTPEVPGGYYAGRHIVNAVRKVINDKDDTRETLLDYNRSINAEIDRKRREFGLPMFQR